MSDKVHVQIASGVSYSPEFLRAVEVLKQTLLQVQVSSALHAKVADADAALRSGAINARQICVLLQGLRDYCRDDELCRAAAQQMARVIMVTKVKTVLSQVYARFETRREKQRSVVNRFAVEPKLHSPETIGDRCLSGQFRTLLSILRDEIKNEPEDTVRAKLMVHADQFELLVMLL